MGNTPVFNWPYPETSAPPDGATQMKTLSLAIEPTVNAVKTTADAAKASATANTTALNRLPARVQAGQTTVAVAGTSASKTVTYPTAFAAAPYVQANMSQAPGALGTFVTAPIGASTTGFTVFLHSVTGVAGSGSVTVDWLAASGTGAQPATAMLAAPAGTHTVSATCHTPGCPCESVTVPGLIVPDVPADWGWTGVYCGACDLPMEVTP